MTSQRETYNKEDVETALQQIETTYGKRFNVFTKWAEVSPVALQAWVAMDVIMAKSKVLSADESQIIQLAVSASNECLYCVNFHTTVGIGAGVSKEDVKAVRAGGLPEEPRLKAMTQTVKLVMEKKAVLTSEDRRLVKSWGVSDAQLYEIATYIGLLTAANYMNLLDMPDTDAEFTNEE